MDTTVFLVRHGVTEWHKDGKVLGQRDLPMTAEGLAQAKMAAAALAETRLADVVSSPLQRALQTADLIAEGHQIEVARDPRLRDFDAGKWTGMRYEDVAQSAEYQRFVVNPMSESIPSGETLAAIQARAVSALEQALSDSPSGDAIAVVTHAGIIRVLLAHYLGSPPANYHRIRVNPGSVSVLSFTDDKDLPRILAINHTASLGSAIASRGGAA